MKLSVEKLAFSYEGRKILDQMGFFVRQGEFVSLLGPSGCGKSTILKILTGVLTPEDGQVLVDGRQIRGVTELFAYMPQNDLLFPWKTILDNVCLYGYVHGDLQAMRREARENFSVFGLSGYEDKYPSQLSGGMRQRAVFEDGSVPGGYPSFRRTLWRSGRDHQRGNAGLAGEYAQTAQQDCASGDP